jgi:hypothetical protein
MKAGRYEYDVKRASGFDERIAVRKTLPTLRIASVRQRTDTPLRSEQAEHSTQSTAGNRLVPKTT